MEKLNAGVHLFLDASTEHTTEKDRDILERNSNRRWDVAQTPRIISHEYGWWINVPVDSFEEALCECKNVGLSKKFLRLYTYARKNNCWWINLDMDAEAVPLP